MNELNTEKTRDVLGNEEPMIDQYNFSRSFFLKGFPVIYFLFDNNEIVYIGKTRRPADRMMIHAKSDKIFDRIEMYNFPNSVLDILEKELILSHKPKYNIKGK